VILSTDSPFKTGGAYSNVDDVGNALLEYGISFVGHPSSGADLAAMTVLTTKAGGAVVTNLTNDDALLSALDFDPFMPTTDFSVAITGPTGTQGSCPVPIIVDELHKSDVPCNQELSFTYTVAVPTGFAPQTVNCTVTVGSPDRRAVSHLVSVQVLPFGDGCMRNGVLVNDDQYRNCLNVLTNSPPNLPFNNAATGFTGDCARCCQISDPVRRALCYTCLNYKMPIQSYNSPFGSYFVYPRDSRPIEACEACVQDNVLDPTRCVTSCLSGRRAPYPSCVACGVKANSTWCFKCITEVQMPRATCVALAGR
jgi:hypothetical protein